MAVGVGHELVGLLGGRVKADGMVHVGVDRKGHVGVQAVYRA